MSSSLVSQAYELIFQREKSGSDPAPIREVLAHYFSGKMDSEKLESQLNEFIESDFKARIKSEQGTQSSEVYDSFISSCSGKPFHKEISRFVSLDLEQSDVSEIGIAKALSSFLTHILIQTEKQEDAYSVLQANALSFQIHAFLSVEVSLLDLQKWLLDTYPSLWGRKENGDETDREIEG